jgi:hypothetical protein
MSGCARVVRTIFELCVRLRGNFCGRGMACVRSKSPHLLHNCGSSRGVNQLRTQWTVVFSELTNFPGLSTERRHVEVSVALQLKHRRRILLLSFVFASSVYDISSFPDACLAKGRANSPLGPMWGGLGPTTGTPAGCCPRSRGGAAGPSAGSENSHLRWYWLFGAWS